MGWQLAGALNDWRKWRLFEVRFVTVEDPIDDMHIYNILEGSTYEISPITAGNRNDSGQPVTVAYQLTGRIDVYEDDVIEYLSNIQDIASNTFVGITLVCRDPQDEQLFITFTDNGNNSTTASGFSARSFISSGDGKELQWSIEFEGIVSADAVTTGGNSIFLETLT